MWMAPCWMAWPRDCKLAQNCPQVVSISVETTFLVLYHWDFVWHAATTKAEVCKKRLRCQSIEMFWNCTYKICIWHYCTEINLFNKSVVELIIIMTYYSWNLRSSLSQAEVTSTYLHLQLFFLMVDLGKNTWTHVVINRLFAKWWLMILSILSELVS